MSRLGSKKKMFLMNMGSSPISESLLFTINTNLDTGSDFTIPTSSGETYNYNVNWGDGNSSYSQTGNATHTYSVDGIYQVEITGTFPKFYFNNTGSKLKITSIDRWGDVGWSVNQSNAFLSCSNLANIAEDCEWINDAVISTNMFRGNNLTSLPSSMTLDNLVIGNLMFYGNNLTSLPSSMTLDSLGNGLNMFNGNTINTARYSQLLIYLEDLNPNDNVPFHGGNSKYNSSAVTARANLITRGWTIIDGGLE